MTSCPQCGAIAPEGGTYCPSCGAALLPPGVSQVAVERKRPPVVTALAVLDFLSGLIRLLLGALFATMLASPETLPLGVILTPFFLSVGVAQLVAGFGLLKLRPWARPLQLAVSIASLINFPFGTLIGGLTIAYLLQPPVKTLFSPKRTEELTPAERAHLVQVHSLGKVTAIVVACVVGIGGIGYVGIVAAIAIPNLLNAIDRGKQKRTMADIRSMGTALEAYREERGGFPEADSPEALEAALVPDYLPSPRRLDGWQHPIAVFSTAETYRIESYGKDGVDGEDPGGEMQQFADDIVFTEGEFFQYPAGLQK